MAPLQHHPTASHQTYLLAQKKPLKGSPRPSRERAPWTPEEDNLLKLAVQLYGDKTEKWAKIAACVPGRTNKNCRKRWFHSLDPSLRKGAWTEEEDQLLREGVSKYPNQWSKIADMLPGRTDDQCAKRWRESLDPSIDRSEWTAMEDNLLMEKYDEYGSQWQKIAFFFDGRPGLHCRNRWRKLQRMVQIKKDKEGVNLNAPFFNTLAEDQSLRFGGGGSSSHTVAASNSHNTTTNNTLISNNNNNSVHSTLTNNTQQQHNNNDNSSSNTNSPHSFHHLTTLLSQQQQQQQPQQQQHDPSILVQFSNQTTNAAQASLTEEYDEYGNGIKPFGCDVPGCYAVFAASTGLFYHMKNSHPHLEGVEKPYRCAMTNCSKKYKNINGLQYHIKDAKGTTGHGGGAGLGGTVDDDRPYRCMIASCKKAYRTASGFRYHQQNGHNISPQGQAQAAATVVPITSNVGMTMPATAQLQQQVHVPQQQQQYGIPQQPQQPQQQQQFQPQSQPQFRMKREKWVMEGV
jgi:hypothetical protein